MIKLIACDMDGTLLDSKKRISPRIGALVAALSKRGILFAAASGRPIGNIAGHFGDAPIAFVADNGGTAYSTERKPVFVGDFSFETAKPALDVIKKTPYMHPALCGLKGIYVQEDDTDEGKAFINFFFNGLVKEVPVLTDVFGADRVSKISVSTGKSGENADDGMRLMQPFTSDFSVVLSGDGWVDLMKKGVTKGTTLAKLREYYGIAADETVVFGDYMNDYDMLTSTPHSYAMANAHPDIKKVCNHITSFTNDEEGVVRELASIFGLSDELGLTAP